MTTDITGRVGTEAACAVANGLADALTVGDGRRATVHDVARAAGVSLASVDRVLNGRSGVTAATVRRVREAVARIGYERDDTAARLATGRQTSILFVLPGAGTNGFMAALRREIGRQGSLLASERVFLHLRTYAALDDSDGLARILDAVEPDAFAGVAVVAIDDAAVRRAIDRAACRGIRVVTLVSDAPQSARVAYVGVDNVAAGRVAATLLGRFAAPGAAKIGLLIGSHALRDHAERAFGIGDELARRFPHATLLPAREGRDDREATRREALALLEAHPDLAGLYNAGAGNRGLLAALAERGRAESGRAGRAGQVAVVAHELTEHARAALVAGHFAAVLHQDQADEVAHAIALLRSREDGAGSAPSRPTRLEIFLEHNLPRPIEA